MTKAFNTLLKQYEAEGKPKGLRLGQFFINHFIREPWPTLYYEQDEAKAKEVIRQWLEDKCYVDEPPTPLNRR